MAQLFLRLFLFLCLVSCVEQGANSLIKSTTVNFVPFELISSNPIDGAVGVGTDETIDLIFNEQVKTSSISFNSSTSSCTGSIQLSSDSFSTCIPLYLVPGTSVTSSIALKPFGGFVWPKSYKLKVTDSLQSSTGKSLSQAIVYSLGFVATSLDSTKPTLTYLNPSNGGEEVDTLPSLQVVFSGAMNASTFTASSDGSCSGNIQLSSDNFAHCVQLVTPVTILYGGAGFSISPLSAITAGMTYKLKLQSMTDLSGNTMTTSTTSFTTARTRVVRVSWADSPVTAVHRLGGGYRVYFSTQSGFAIDHYLTQSVSVPYQSGSYAPNYFDIEFPHKGKWYFKVTSFSSDNPIGSEPSSEFSLEVL